MTGLLSFQATSVLRAIAGILLAGPVIGFVRLSAIVVVAILILRVLPRHLLALLMRSRLALARLVLAGVGLMSHGKSFSLG